MGGIIILLFFALVLKKMLGHDSVSGKIFSLAFSATSFFFMSFFEFIKNLLGYSSSIYGSAQYLGYMEERKLLNTSNQGTVIDGIRKLSIKKSYSHCLITAPTGMGKSVTFVTPNIVSHAKYGHSMVVTDPSGELYELTKDYLSKKSYDLRVLNVTDLKHSARYNPLHRCNSFSEIAKVADILVDTAIPPSNSTDSFWNDSAKTIINIVIRYLCKKDPKYKNLHNLNNILIQLGGSKAQKDKIDRMMARELDQASFEAYTAFISQGDKTFASCMSNAKVALSKISNDQILAELTLSETLNFESIREKPTAIFLIIPEHELGYYSFLSTLLFTQLFNECMKPKVKGQPYNSCFFLMDEFANTGKIPGFETIITTIRKREVSLNLVIQDLTQLYAVYGNHTAQTIMSNCLSQIYFPGLSLQTTQHLERILGTATIQHTESGFSLGQKKSREMGRPLLTSDEIRTLPDGQAIFLHSNKRPVILKTTPWFKNSRIKRRLS